MSSAETKPLAQRFQELAKTLQFAWFAGHLMLILNSVLYVFQFVKFNTNGGFARFTYRVAFLSAILTYSIVIYRTVTTRQNMGNRAPAGAAALIGDENVQYLVMSIFWWFMPHFTLALLPYFIYSIFHVATYMRSTIVPLVYPPTIVNGTSTPQPSAERWVSYLRSFINSHYESSMTLVAGFEVGLWIELALYALLFRSWSWVLITVYTGFLRVRYSQSLQLQAMFSALTTQIDSKMAYQGTPPALQNGWETSKSLVKQFYAATDISKFTGGASAPKKSS